MTAFGCRSSSGRCGHVRTTTRGRWWWRWCGKESLVVVEIWNDRRSTTSRGKREITGIEHSSRSIGGGVTWCRRGVGRERGEWDGRLHVDLNECRSECRMCDTLRGTQTIKWSLRALPTWMKISEWIAREEDVSVLILIFERGREKEEDEYCMMLMNTKRLTSIESNQLCAHTG